MTDKNPVKLAPVEKRRFWQEQIKRQLHSRMSQAHFCEQHGLKIHQFTYWKSKHRKNKVDADVTFVSVPIAGFRAPASDRATLHLITSAGHRIAVCPGFDPVTLKQLIAALEVS